MEKNTKIFIDMIKQIGEVAYSNHIFKTGSLDRRFCGSSKKQTAYFPQRLKVLVDCNYIWLVG